MAEKEIIADNLRIHYEGVVDPQELIRFIDKWARMHGYNKTELKDAERITEEERYMELKYVLSKAMTEILSKNIKLIIKIKHMQEVRIEKQGLPLVLMNGETDIVLDGSVVTDIEHRWEMKPTIAFTRAVLEKFLLGNYIDKYRSDIAADANRLHSELKSFFSLYRYAE